MEVIDPLSDVFSPEANLPPLKRILSMYTSESVENRWVWLCLVGGVVVLKSGRDTWRVGTRYVVVVVSMVC